ncbi:MAG: hypothetical protein M5R36_06535 [Deltaproteobacteria bacterium]|nr:hypothetical protein [Deltaproteobacteria bacterium]
MLATGALSSLVPAGLGLFVVAAALCSIRVKSWRPRAGLGAFFISWPMAVFYGAVVAHVTWALTSASHFVSGPPPVWSWATVHAWCLAMLVGMPYNTVATMFVPERLYTAYAAAPYPSVIAVSFWLLLAAALVEIRRRRGAVPGALIAALVLVLLYCLMLSVTKYDFLANVGRIDGLNRYAERYWLAPYALSLYAVFRIGELLAAERRFRGLLSAGMAMMVIVVLFNATNLHPYQNFHWPSQAEKKSFDGRKPDAPNAAYPPEARRTDSAKRSAFRSTLPAGTSYSKGSRGRRRNLGDTRGRLPRRTSAP